MEEMQLVYSGQINLMDIAKCHIKAFPNSLSSRLGIKYCFKMLEWYIVAPNRFLFHLEFDNKIIGYCGGFVKAGETHGSSTGMTQHALNEGIYSLLKRPWLLFHSHLLNNYKFLLLNLLIRFKRKQKIVPHPNLSTDRIAGLVVIGVEPQFRGKGLGSILIREFERKAVEMKCTKLILTVESQNNNAIMSYKSNGWFENENKGNSMSMYKIIAE